jgi:hypothetical protein
MRVKLYLSSSQTSEDRHEQVHHHCCDCRCAALHDSYWTGNRADRLTPALRVRALRERSAGLVMTVRPAGGSARR